MSDTLDRTKVTFAQAEGRETLPSQLQVREMSNGLRAALWKVVYKSWMESVGRSRNYSPAPYYFVGNWRQMLEDLWVFRVERFIDEFDNLLDFWVNIFKPVFIEGEYIDVFDFLQFTIRHRECPPQFVSNLSDALNVGRAAYRIIDTTIMPISSEQDAATIQSAFKAAGNMGWDGAKSHLVTAGELLSRGDWAGSVRESIHSVESALKVIEPTETTLSSVLRRLEKDGEINPNLKRAMSALYEYSSDEKGIRHAKVLSDANVDEADAMYMFGVCSAFITFLSYRFSSRH